MLQISIVHQTFRLLSVTVFLLTLITLQGCARQGYSVLALTTTIIGVEVSQNPANQTPQAKLGYNRGEFAFVPTNRTGGEDPAKSHLGGALDSANVLMELRYGGIFDMGATSGIYQRLAVGETAVKQTGAAAMFFKDAAGNVDPTVKDALKDALTANQLKAIEVTTKAKIRDDDAKIAAIIDKVAPGGNLDKTKLASAIDSTSGQVDSSIVKRIKSYKTAGELKKGLEVRDNDALQPLFTFFSQ